jgi:hypothetical protein
MNRSLSIVGFAALLIAAAMLLALSSPLLPESVAAHFDAYGNGESDLARADYLWLMAGLTIALPLALVALMTLQARFAPGRLKLPHRDLWFAPERRAESLAFLFTHATRLGAALTALMMFVHLLVIQANRTQPARLPMGALLAGLSLFGLALLAWVLALRSQFREAP